MMSERMADGFNVIKTHIRTNFVTKELNYNELAAYEKISGEGAILSSPKWEQDKYAGMFVNGDFDYERLGDYLVENKASEEVEFAILDMFLHMQNLAGEMTNALNATSHDTFGASKTRLDTAAYVETARDTVNTSFITGLVEIQNRTMIKPFYDVVNASATLYNDLFAINSSKDPDLFRDMMSFSEDLAEANGKPVGEMAQRVSRDFMTFLLHSDLGKGKYIDTRSAYSEYVLGQGSSYKDETGESISLIEYLHKIKSGAIKGAKAKRLRNNSLIKELTPYISTDYIDVNNVVSPDAYSSEQRFSNISMFNRLSTTQVQNDLFKSALEIRDVHPVLYEDLIRMGVAQHGINRTTGSYMEYIPFFEISDVAQEQLKQFNALAPNFRRHIFDRFLNQFSRRNSQFMTRFKGSYDARGEFRMTRSKDSAAAKTPYALRYYMRNGQMTRELFQRIDSNVHSPVGFVTFAPTGVRFVGRQGWVGYDYSISNDNNLPQDDPVIDNTSTDLMAPTSVINETGSADPANFTNFSGGAEGADSAFYGIGVQFGVTKQKHFYHGKKSPTGNTEITQKQFEEGKQKVKEANDFLERNPTRYMSLLSRNWQQVKNADTVFAVSEFVDAENSREVKGGTGWAVEMAYQNNVPVFVFDQVDGKTYTLDRNISTKPIEVSGFDLTLTENFAGIGSRQLNDQGIEWIKRLHENTFGQPDYISENNEVLNFTQGIVSDMFRSEDENPTKTVLERFNKSIVLYHNAKHNVRSKWQKKPGRMLPNLVKDGIITTKQAVMTGDRWMTSRSKADIDKLKVGDIVSLGDSSNTKVRITGISKYTVGEMLKKWPNYARFWSKAQSWTQAYLYDNFDVQQKYDVTFQVVTDADLGIDLNQQLRDRGFDSYVTDEGQIMMSSDDLQKFNDQFGKFIGPDQLMQERNDKLKKAEDDSKDCNPTA
jgi:hypothetical protein